MKSASELTEPGYYWWLPECFKDNADRAEFWTIESWHPLDASSPKSGRFVGPLVAPISAP